VPERPSAEEVEAILDAIPGAHERFEEARRQAARGEGIPLDQVGDRDARAEDPPGHDAT
jgi:hypothetical protein